MRRRKGSPNGAAAWHGDAATGGVRPQLRPRAVLGEAGKEMSHKTNTAEHLETIDVRVLASKLDGSSHQKSGLRQDVFIHHGKLFVSHLCLVHSGWRRRNFGEYDVSFIRDISSKRFRT